MTIRLVRTCEACPEQYDAFHKGELIGYLRVRHGDFQCDWFPPGQRGNMVGRWTVYESRTVGDGMFTDWERDRELRMACAFLLAAEMVGSTDKPLYQVGPLPEVVPDVH